MHGKAPYVNAIHAPDVACKVLESSLAWATAMGPPNTTPFPPGFALSLAHVMTQVGSEVARRARGLGMQIIAHDPFASEAKAAAIGVRLVSWKEALGSGDFFSLHTPLTPQTKVCTALEAPTCHSMSADGDHFWHQVHLQFQSKTAAV